MNEAAVRVEGLGKRYRIRAAGRRAWREVWALRDATFAVAPGEVVGLVGPNGAGKSTLLKLLSRITAPTAGFAELRGRTASLLEVGTGFHPELTGRDNVFLSGVVLGMRKAEVQRRFDEIVAFAGVDAFIDTPVKHYSSGMQVRLAFAVAAHLDAVILIVDEVLAVGDAAFQEKCLGQMDRVRRAGRTVLFVSHNLAAIRAHCPRSLWLSEGRIVQDGPSDAVVDAYLASLQRRAQTPLAERADREGDGRVRFTAARAWSVDGEGRPGLPTTGRELRVGVRYERREEAIGSLRVALLFLDAHGQRLFVCDTRLGAADFASLPPRGEIVCAVPNLPLAAGEYAVNLWGCLGGDVSDQVAQGLRLVVGDGDFYGTGERLDPPKQGSFAVEHRWSLAEEA